MDINAFRIDEKKVETGLWKTVYEDDVTGEKFEILVTKIPNKRFSQLLTRLQKPYQKLRRAGGEIPTKEAEEITAKTMAQTVLLDWRGLTENGVPVTYSKEKAEELLIDVGFVIPPDWIPFQEIVVMHARDVADFLTDDIEADLKNSKAGVGGKPPTPAK